MSSAVVTLRDFYPYVLPSVYECPLPSVDIAIRDACRDFCKQTWLWKEDIDPTPIDPEFSTVMVATPPGTQLEAILRCYVDGDEIYAAQERDVVGAGPMPTSKPKRFVFRTDDELMFYPTPDQEYTLTGVMVLVPTVRATTVLDDLFESYAEIVASGALHKLLLVPGKPWSDDKLALIHARKFKAGVNNARIRESRNTFMRVRSHPF